MSLTGKTNAQKIWNYLIAKGLSTAGAAGGDALQSGPMSGRV